MTIPIIGIRALLAACFMGLSALVPADAETLTEALISAYQTNPQLAAARAGLRVTDEQLALALSAFRPSITLQGSGGRSTIRLQQERRETLAPFDGQAQLVQPLFPLSGFAALRSADAQIEQGRANLAAVEQQVFLSVVSAYLNVIRDQALVNITAEIEGNLERELEANRSRFNEGDVSQTDIALTQTRLSQVQADHVAAQLNLRRARSAYEEVVGHPPLEVSPPGLPPGLPGTKEEATAIAIKGNPTLLEARRAEDVARADIGRAEAALYPSLNLVAAGAYSENQSFDNQQEEQYSLQLQLRVPLYEGGATQSQIRRAKEFWNQQRAGTVAVEREVVRLVADAFDGLVTSGDVIGYAREGVKGAEAALKGVREEAGLGFRTTTDVLDSEQDLLNAQSRLAIAERDEVFAGWQLLSAVGAFSAQETGLVTELYDAKAHAEEVGDAWFATDPLAPGLVPVPTSTAPAPLIPPEATRPGSPAMEPVQAAVSTPAGASEGEGFWTTLLGIPADEIQPP
ncbi:hypothetical protein D3874_04860 [Oleomonas cavernae]|uniref:Type I secretion protein TolC n=1 Tax=Oleomonas cavernae TaxID=2320859 RepID=A0A418W8X1_9PROT|nr:TolC family outer membrane protein [Oleomonas cavernae]RJF86438.1 hypothetical protein D3874_04860 [Oleomonas cavernae]